ncbi:hypothetical protein [Halobacteriovorax sp.]|uniref:hypothetical protein n=1 Tax=Halobacteriovorax sp. TaxID=2020862 RepID=UPI003AF20D29
MKQNDYPKEFYVTLQNNDNLLGQIEVNRTNNGFNAEVAIVFKETKKIFKYVDQVFGAEDETEACDIGMMKLSRFLKSIK